MIYNGILYPSASGLSRKSCAKIKEEKRDGFQTACVDNLEDLVHTKKKEEAGVWKNMTKDQRKVVLVGTGMVGTSYAYVLMNQRLCNQIVLIDQDMKRAEGEAMDLSHGLAFASAAMKITAGGYEECQDADLVVICAGTAQRLGETRLDLLQRNADVLKSIVKPVVESGFDGIFLVATNPVDIMTRVVQEISGFPAHRVLGSGTTLDTARLRYLLGEYFTVDPRNVHAYVIGEHGDSEFVPWSQALIATKPVTNVCEDAENGCQFCELEEISHQVRESAYVIIEAKKATYYGIGMALARITKAIFEDENSILTLSVAVQGQYGLTEGYLGLPVIVNREGAQRMLSLRLTEEEKEKLHASAKALQESYLQLKL